jgi:uncharacterized damage-inducible protein DinB
MTMRFTTPVRRVVPPHVAGERQALSAWLDYHRATLLGKLEGLDDEQLRRPMVPSGVCLLGLVKHLTAVEHGWFVVNFARSGESHLFVRPDGSEADFVIEDGETTDAVVAGYLRACARSRGVTAHAGSLDQRVAHPRAGEMDLRWLLVHMIEETARHNGHADVIRELLDGTTGD